MQVHAQLLTRAQPSAQVRAVSGGLAALLAGMTGDSPADFLVVDERVRELYGPDLAAVASLPLHVVPSGESSKCFGQLESLLGALATAGLDRSSRLLALGGGVTCDLAGLAAALYMRGICWTAVPTTLLAQVDASIGGKTAINLPHGKNLVGAFHQPSDVLIDASLLTTLSEDEWLSGLGEVLKAALLGARLASGKLLFDWLEELPPELLASREPAHMRELVWACVAHKAAVVEVDPKEAGARLQLNLGHTFAHAIEQVAGLGRVPHGIAVAAGLGLALALAEREGALDDLELPGRSAQLAGRLGLPAGLADLERRLGETLEQAALLEAMRLDKKAGPHGVRLVVPRALGSFTLLDDAVPL